MSAKKLKKGWCAPTKAEVFKNKALTMKNIHIYYRSRHSITLLIPIYSVLQCKVLPKLFYHENKI